MTTDEETTTTTTTIEELANQSEHKPEAGVITESTTVTAGASVTTTGSDLASNVKSPTTNDNTQTQDDLIVEAQGLALHNHAVEHADDPVNKDDKTRV